MSCFHQATCTMLPIIYLPSKLLIKVVIVEMIIMKNKTCKKTTCCNVNLKNTQSLLISFENQISNCITHPNCILVLVCNCQNDNLMAITTMLEVHWLKMKLQVPWIQCLWICALWLPRYCWIALHWLTPKLPQFA